MKDRTFTLTNIDTETCSELSKNLFEIEEYDAEMRIANERYVKPPIEILIESNGGEIYPAFGLASVIMTLLTPVHTYCLGSAFSSASLILISGHCRYAYKYSTAMIHGISDETYDNVSISDLDEKETKRLEKQMVEIYSTYTHIPKRKLNQVIRDKIDWYIKGSDMLKYDLVDELL